MLRPAKRRAMRGQGHAHGSARHTWRSSWLRCDSTLARKAAGSRDRAGEAASNATARTASQRVPRASAAARVASTMRGSDSLSRRASTAPAWEHTAALHSSAARRTSCGERARVGEQEAKVVGHARAHLIYTSRSQGLKRSGRQRRRRILQLALRHGRQQQQRRRRQPAAAVAAAMTATAASQQIASAQPPLQHCDGLAHTNLRCASGRQCS